MKISNILLTATALLLGVTACDKFLDVNPDNRATIDSEDKVIKLLTSAYSNNDYLLMTELMSDNTDDYPTSPYTSRFTEQLYYWQDVTESDNSDGIYNK